jgi:nuclear pore complex protein Nup205
MSYIHMLCGLSTGEESAQHCFVLLQHNGDFYDAQNPNISWNHIFYAFERYYDSLRIDFLQKQQNQNQANQSIRGVNLARGNIAQQELKALVLVVKLVNQITNYSEKSRIALCEFQRGFETATNVLMPHHINAVSLPILMFGLLGCPIPVNLKGEILTLLSSLSQTPQIATGMWQALENSQILQTISTNLPRSGIEVELEEIENKEETYPLLIGFLSLIKTLINVKIPENLGVGFRSKGVILGFQPYLQFLVNSVYLKVTTRPYTNPEEKWQIAGLILEIFLKLIKDYEINMNDFKFPSSSYMQLDDQPKMSEAKSPGYRLMYEFLHHGPIVNQLFKLLNESLHYFCEYNAKTDPTIDNASLVILKIIHVVLNKQRFFIDCMKNANMNITNTGLENLLVLINPKTNKVDSLMSVFRYIQFSSQLHKHAYYATCILYELCQYSNINQHILNFFLCSCTSSREQYDILNGFVESVEVEDDDLIDMDEMHSYSEPDDDHKYRSMARFKILQLILFNLKLNSINLSHLLLGFDLQKPLHKWEFFLPGTNISKSDGAHSMAASAAGTISTNIVVQRNCLHSIIDRLNSLLIFNEPLKGLHLTINICYEILYNLCSNNAISNQILHYLRNEYDFVYVHLKQIPLKSFKVEQPSAEQTTMDVNTLIDNDMDDDANVKAILKQEQDKQKSNLELQQLNRFVYSTNASVLYLTCIELKNLVLNRMRAQATKLLQLLIDTTSQSIDISAHSNSMFFNLDQSQQANQLEESSKLNRLLDMIDFRESLTPKPLNLNYFDTALTEKVISTCKVKTDFVGTTLGTIELYNLKQIQAILMNEITADANLATSKLNILHEIKQIVNNINERNQFQLRYASKKRYIDSFKMLVECMIALLPVEIFDFNLRYKFILNLMKKFLDLVFVDDVLIELTNPIPTLLFTLMCNLKFIIDETTKQQISSDAMNTALVKNLLNPSCFHEILSKTLDYLLSPCK